MACIITPCNDGVVMAEPIIREARHSPHELVCVGGTMLADATEIALRNFLNSRLAIDTTSTAAIARLIAYPISRPTSEFKYYLQRFPEIPVAKIDAIITELQTAGYLEWKTIPRGIQYLQISSNIEHLLETAMPSTADQADLASKIAAVRAARRNTWTVHNLGPLRDDESLFETWIDAINSSRRSVVIWVMSSAYPEVLAAVNAAARRGLDISVLIGSPAFVGKLRGNDEGQRAFRSGLSWASALKSYPTAEVRWATSLDDLSGAGSSLIDGQLLRYTIYDPLAEQGTSGSMLEVYSQQQRHNVNLMRIYSAVFDAAWARGTPIRISGIRGWLNQKLNASVILARFGKAVSWFVFSVLLFLGTLFLSRQCFDEVAWADTAKNVLYGFIGVSISLAIQRAWLGLKDYRKYRGQL